MTPNEGLTYLLAGYPMQKASFSGPDNAPTRKAYIAEIAAIPVEHREKILNSAREASVEFIPSASAIGFAWRTWRRNHALETERKPDCDQCGSVGWIDPTTGDSRGKGPVVPCPSCRGNSASITTEKIEPRASYDAGMLARVNESHKVGQ